MAESFDARRKKLGEAIRARRADLPPSVARLGDALWNDADDSLSHAQCLDALPTFVSAEVQDAPVAKLYPEVKHHLDRCPSCSSQYAELLELSLAEAEGQLPEPTAVPVPDLSFLPPPLTLRDVVAKLVREVLTRLDPKQLAELKFIEKPFFARVQKLGDSVSLRTVGVPALSFRGDRPSLALRSLLAAYTTLQVLAALPPEQIAEWERQTKLLGELEALAFKNARAAGIDERKAVQFASEFAAAAARDPASWRTLLQKP